MPFIEQILYGSESGQRGAARTVLAQSPGMGSETAAEIRRLCDNWGELPVAGLVAPAILSVPLKASMPAMRGQLWAVLRMAPGDAAFVHGVVLNDADFAAYGRNPFALVQAVDFLEEWRPGIILDRRTVEETHDSHLVAPPPGKGDLALVLEAIRHLLTRSKLLLPLEQPGPEADRALALIIAALPAPMRKDLRFASWAGSEANSWRIAAMSKTGCPFSGWQRLLLAEVAAIVPDAVEQYARQVGDRLGAGDLPGLCRVGRDQAVIPGTGPKTATAPAPSRQRAAAPPSRPAPAPRERRPARKPETPVARRSARKPETPAARRPERKPEAPAARRPEPKPAAPVERRSEPRPEAPVTRRPEPEPAAPVAHHPDPAPAREAVPKPEPQPSRPVDPVVSRPPEPAAPPPPAAAPPQPRHPARPAPPVEPTGAAPVTPLAPSPVAADRPAANYVHPARRGGNSAATSMPAIDERSPRPAATPRPSTRSRLASAGRAVGAAGRRRPTSRRLIPLVVCGLVVTAVCWWKMPDITAFLSTRFGWFHDEPAHGHDSAAASLLRVVDVGAVYQRSLTAVARAGAGAGAGGGVRDRRKVKLSFQSEAAGPLLQQVDLFADLAADGLQQGDRPDREIERMKALASRGRVLEQEMRRLELAWYSLASGVDWRDLGDLDDARVAARRDSLKAATPAALADAGRDVGTTSAWSRLRTARLQVAGMAGLLGAFGAVEWSESWENDLYSAAEKVSPSASDVTRAYRNSAFALVRLKRAERGARARALPFADEFGDGVWPAADVRDVLSDLRRQVRKFGDAAVPELLGGTLELYDDLGKAGSLAREAAAGDALEQLERNPAVAFDRDTYNDYLERIRFEAARAALESHPDSVAAAIPRHLYAGQDSLMAWRFYATLAETNASTAWRVETQTQENPFLARWAGHKADQALAREQARRNRFDADWRTCVERAAQVKVRAAEGRDWTAQWLDLRDATVSLLDTHVRTAGSEPKMAARLNRAADLVRAMSEPRPLGVTAVTVRFPQDVLTGPQTVVVEFQVAGQSVPLRSPPLSVGPAAPEGSGWVGTASVDWWANVAAGDACTVRVMDTAGRELLQVAYPSLADRGGPGALVRPRGGDAGTVAFQLAPSWWSRLDLPWPE